MVNFSTLLYYIFRMFKGENWMIVGYMRNASKPTHFSTVSTLISKAKGIDLLYFNAKDVDMENDKINGRMLINDEWVRVEKDIPKVIDISAFCVRHKEVVNYLRGRAYLTGDLKHRLSKEKLQRVMSEDDSLSKYTIPSGMLESFEELNKFIEEYGEIVIKPVYSRRGRGVYIIKKQDDNYYVGIQLEDMTLDIAELKELYEKEIKSTPHIIQKAMTSRTPSGDPFDCRVHLEKNSKGKWRVLHISARIGIGQKVISNISYGGGRAKIEPFLEMNYGDKWESIHEELKSFSLKLARKIERVRKTELMTLGLDVGIDPEGNLFIFEANSAPGADVIKSEVALSRANYYKYLLNKHA